NDERHADRQHHRLELADDVDAVQSLVAGAARLPADDGGRVPRRRHPRFSRRRLLQLAVQRIHGAGSREPAVTGKRTKAGILDFAGASPRGGLLGGLNDNAILDYLAGALQGGNLGQSIGHGLAGWLTGARFDQRRLASAQTYRALAEAGVPDAMAKAAALNPQIMKAVAPAYFGREPFKDVASLNAVVGRLGDLVTARTRAPALRRRARRPIRKRQRSPTSRARATPSPTTWRRRCARAA